MTTIPNQKLETLEDEYDARVGELAYQEYLQDVKSQKRRKNYYSRRDGEAVIY